MLASREFAASVSPRCPELVKGLLMLAADPNIIKDPVQSKKGPQPARTSFRSRFFDEGPFFRPLNNLGESFQESAGKGGKGPQGVRTYVRIYIRTYVGIGGEQGGVRGPL